MRPVGILRWLLCLAIGLPVLIIVLQFAGKLLSLMGDQPGSEVIRGIVIGCGVVWAVALLGIVIVVAIETIDRGEPPEGSA